MRTPTALGEEPQPPKSCLITETELDRISNLPSEVTGHILSHLTMKEAARTSVLSTKWRYRWAMLPDLVFNYHEFDTKEGIYESSTTRIPRVARIIDQILLTYIGPIHKFELSGQCGEMTDIGRWILHLSRISNIKECKLKTSLGGYKIPSCFFSWCDMIRLELTGCWVKPPSTFKGFRSLKILTFQFVKIDQDVFESMIGCSSLLEKLDLIHCRGLSQFKIDAPSLQYLHLQGSFEDVTIVSTLNLTDVDIDIVPMNRNFQGLKIHSVKYLADGVLPEKLPDPLLELKFLTIALCFHNLDEVEAAHCLLRSSPSLEKLEIKKALRCLVHTADGSVNSWTADNYSNSFTQLRHVKITSICGIEAELNFIRFLLSSSPVLETMTVTPGYQTDSLDLVKKLLRFKRASTNLEIIYSD